MLNKNAKEWVTALRSGKYPQGFGRLMKHGAFCCLGVAASICPDAEPGWVNRSLLPPEVQGWLNLGSWDGAFQHATLANLNDQENTFAEIADIIESEPEGLFREVSNGLE